LPWGGDDPVAAAREHRCAGARRRGAERSKSAFSFALIFTASRRFSASVSTNPGYAKGDLIASAILRAKAASAPATLCSPPAERCRLDQIAVFTPLICTSARWNLAACGTNHGEWERRFALGEGITPSLQRASTAVLAPGGEVPPLSHIMYSLISFRTSTPSQNHQFNF